MRVIVIGASGFVGSHLVHELIAHGHKVSVVAAEEGFQNPEVGAERTFSAHIDDPEQVGRMLSSANPEWIVNLAAQSSVSRSWADPIGTAQVNILGPLTLFEAVRKAKLRPRILCIGSSEEYGESGSSAPVSEAGSLAPKNPYGVSKYAQELYCLTYFEAYGMDLVLVRAFPHTGPGQSRGFVVPDFCAQIASAEREDREPVIEVGNLQSRRDISDVRDIVRGYVMLLESGQAGKIYNIGSGKTVQTGEILDNLLSKASRFLRVRIAAEKLRPVEVSAIVADTSLIRSAIGWEPEISLEKTLSDTLAYWRRRVVSES